MKRIVVWLVVIIVIALSVGFPNVMLNPGDLVEGHQEIKNKCTSCHKPFWGIEAKKCISCHELSEIGRDTVSKGDLSKENELVLFHEHLQDQECTNCHTDHKGIFPDVPVSTFNHDLLSFSIQGKCNSCHGKPSDKLHTQLSTDCKSCHNTDSWALSGKFNHDLITGVYKTNCSSCHDKPSDSFHQSLKETCTRCHNTSKWSPSTFDHTPYFFLDHDHNVKCATCHTGNDFGLYTCYGCHEHSESKIREEHNEHGIYDFSDCASCHKSADEHDIKNYKDGKNKMDKNEIKKIKEHIESNGKSKHKKKKDED